ncbi:family 16 glycosylhydrolase [Nocardioides stalactiti]|uniref:family 16 glycosylhydrolase n=1 Tax=Nocardioides stalactiti TaxID=2755356 RepID=UPI00160340AD|nr:family 16 glycosylhydrolase [Nocardioides stalactiti]
MKRLSLSVATRVVALVTALVVGPATLAPGTAEAPSAESATVARAGDGTTAAQTYDWGVMLWDFAWEFGESLDSPPYRGSDIGAGKWIDHSTGTGRAVKYGGGIEFHTGRYKTGSEDPDFGNTTLTLEEQPQNRGRWELRERSQELETKYGSFTFAAELIPADPADCGKWAITIGRSEIGSGNITVGVTAGATSWTKTLTGYGRGDTDGRLYGVQITRRRITWFVNGKAVASLGDTAAVPKVPMTVRMSVVGKGTTNLNASVAKIDWVRAYDLTRGTRPPAGAKLTKGSTTPGC